MTKAELLNEMRRLYAGFDVSHGLLTHERMNALFERFGHVSLGAFSGGVDRALLEHKLPTIGQLAGFVELAAERERGRTRAENDAAAKRVMDGTDPRIASTGMTRDDLEGCRAYRKVCQHAWDHGITPEKTAFVVAELTKRWPWLWAEVDALWEMGTEWMNAAQHRWTLAGKRPATHELPYSPRHGPYREIMEGETQPDVPPDGLSDDFFSPPDPEV